MKTRLDVGRERDLADGFNVGEVACDQRAYGFPLLDRQRDAHNLLRHAKRVGGDCAIGRSLRGR
jgi:hypothetical protein